MAWTAIADSGGWEWNNTPADPGANSPLRPLWLESSGGIRTETHGNVTHEVYVDCRKIKVINSQNVVVATGELSKTYWDAH